jgi:lipopolysaccharide export system permease protein
LRKFVEVKRLSFFLLKIYIGPFILTFLIAQFVLVMQFLWKYIDELAGKGLEWGMVMELLFYASATLVPMALPLAILLSSIMTIGALAENLELVAAKSSGISLLRLLRPLIVTAGVISIMAFLFSNYTLPVANYKFRALLSAIRSARPAIDLTEGTFYSGIKGITVYIEKKNPDGKSFEGVMVYDHSGDGKGASVLTLAERGQIRTEENDNFLVFALENGVRYDDREFYLPSKGAMQVYREHFELQELWIDISDGKVSREGMSFMRNSFAMMNLNQLASVIEEKEAEIPQTVENLSSRAAGLDHKGRNDGIYSPIPQELNVDESGEIPLFPALEEPIQMPDFSSKSAFFNEVKSHQEAYLMEQFRAALLSSMARTEDIQRVTQSLNKGLAAAKTEWHRKFTLSFACLVLFFIGAPLGAIIRKGGLGLPLIACVLIFIIYHVISSIAETSVKNLVMSPMLGMWFSNLVLLPFGIFLTLKVSTDSRWFALETYQMILKRWLKR